MTPVVRRSTLDRLAESDNGLHVSIYLPVERAGDQTQQNPIRFKNSLQQAEDQLEKMGVRRVDRQALLKPGEHLLEDHEFWQSQDLGLAVFLHDGESEAIQLPAPVEALTVCGSRFHLKPLIPFADGQQNYYALALERGGIQLYQGDRFKAEALPLTGTPESLEEYLEWDDPETQLQWHSASNSLRFRGGDGQSVFHGHGAGSEEEIETEQLLRFLRALDSAVDDMLAGDQAPPLVLMGDDALIGHFRKVSSYPNLIDQASHAVPHEMSPAEIHERTWPLVADRLGRSEEEARQSYLAADSDRQITQLEPALKAAVDGQISDLFLPRGEQCWGAYEAEDRSMTLAQNGDEPAEDLYDRAAIATFQHDGSVHLVEDDEIPGDGNIAATLRYSVS